MNAPIKSLDQQFAFAPQTPIFDRLNRLLVALEARFRSVEATRADYDAAVDKLTLLGLARINETLGPATQKILDLTSLGFLICESDSSMLLETGVDKSIIVTAGTQRDLFAPTAFVAVQRKSNFTDWGYAEVQTYDRLSGALGIRFLAIYGDPGPHDDWQISDAPGVSEATYYWYLQTVAARDAAVAARDLALVYRNQAADQAAIASTATGADISILVRRDGSTAFTAAQSGVAPLAAADNAQFPTTAWVWDRLDAFDALYPLLNGSRDFNQVQRGVTPGSTSNNTEFPTTFWTLARVVERLAPYAKLDGSTPFVAVQSGVTPPLAADNSFKFPTTAWVNARVAVSLGPYVKADGSVPFTAAIGGVAPAAAANDASLVTAAWSNARIAALLAPYSTAATIAATYAPRAGGFGFGAVVSGVAPAAGSNDANYPTTAWVQAELTARFAALIGAAPAALDTVYELAAQMQADEGALGTLTTAVANRVRVDVAQGLSPTQKATARQNIGTIVKSQCYLSNNATDVALDPDDGNLVYANGRMEVLPGQISFSGNDLAYNTLYNVYAYMDGVGGWHLVPDLGAYALDGNRVRVHSANAAYTWVGLVGFFGSVITQEQLMCVSWYNKRRKTFQAGAAGGTVSGTSANYFNTGIGGRVDFLCFSGFDVDFFATGQATTDASSGSMFLSEGTRNLGLGQYVYGGAGAPVPVNLGGPDQFPDGLYTVGIAGAVATPGASLTLLNARIDATVRG